MYEEEWSQFKNFGMKINISYKIAVSMESWALFAACAMSSI
jgi:hypothetical protein